MITARQKRLLEAIIKEFVDTAEAVGSIDLPEKYELKVSPATIRNEMATLVDLGYLEKPHASSGRVPTTMAFKYFLKELVEELEELDVRKSTYLSEDLFQKRYNWDQLMLSAVRALTELTSNASVALIDDRIYHSGLNYLVDNPEYQDSKTLKYVLTVLEDYARLAEIFGRSHAQDEVKVLIGEDFDHVALRESAMVFANIRSYGNRDGYIAVFGPNRMNYKKVIPSIKYISNQITNSLDNWVR